MTKIELEFVTGYDMCGKYKIALNNRGDKIYVEETMICICAKWRTFLPPYEHLNFHACCCGKCRCECNYWMSPWLCADGGPYVERMFTHKQVSPPRQQMC